MRPLLAFVTAVFVLAPLSALAWQAPTSTLSYGQTASGVLLLQQALNQSTDTQIAATGSGSPGHETTYFGGLTLSAVKRFQAKYSLPQTGFVGPLTLAVLAGLAQAQPAATPSAPTVPTTAPIIVPQTPVTAPTLPVSVAATSTSSTTATPALNQYLATMRQEGAAQGYTAAQLDTIEAAIRAQQASSTVDYTTQFYAQQQLLYRQTHSLIYATVHALASLVLPDTAQAATGLPFGGFVTLVLPICTCDPVVQQLFVSLANPTPTSNLTLNYVDGTEAFLWHNLPEPGVATLGSYIPGTQECFIIVPHSACMVVPAVGTISPETGSSATPTF